MMDNYEVIKKSWLEKKRFNDTTLNEKKKRLSVIPYNNP